MRRWKIKPTPCDIPSAFVSRVISGIGTPDLAQWILDAIQQLIPASHCTVFVLEANGRVSALSTASAHGAVASVTAVEYRQNRFDMLDNNMVWLARKKTPTRSQTWMSHQFAEDVADPYYRHMCYSKPGIRERASVLLLNKDGQRIAVSFYRNLAFESFDASDFETIAQCGQILHEVVIAHIRKTFCSAASDVLHQHILTQLAHRERQVISCVLAGNTTNEIALQLDLSPRTVLTYRYRAFAKLGVRTQRELLAMLNSPPANLPP
ncbi:LuxR C-terminal-related transcriptional regulator [Paraburkholderia acidiphila]|uniref:Helix-turn-helix transcriptional regulator n=1 Tax=Paraburkholderia acidiphila TaxID=2571747 RepID=A0A7Z2G878_9BURK|nr:LuxR C-terminal-related transcriptional regulator [Paraburkholderia acidiphila]QGZ56864.1 helix-turn-helix transcriptional regulator [Paraburkholderia acidiphila]